MSTANRDWKNRWYAHQQTLRRALWISVAVHLLAATAVNPGLILRLFRPKVMVGYPGSPATGDLAPSGEPRETDVSLVRTHRFRGDVHLVALQPAGSEPHPDEPADRAASNALGVPQGAARSRGQPGLPRPGQAGAGPFVELDENWVAVRGSSRLARSENFQTLKIVRPEYPLAAIHAGVTLIR